MFRNMSCSKKLLVEQCILYRTMVLVEEVERLAMSPTLGFGTSCLPNCVAKFGAPSPSSEHCCQVSRQAVAEFRLLLQTMKTPHAYYRKSKRHNCCKVSAFKILTS